MIYRVRARPIRDKGAEFFAKLTNGTISAQKPDGAEIVASMKRAKTTQSGHVEWFEICYCPTPLKHERETVLDHYFTEIETTPAEEMAEIEGESYWETLGNSPG